MCAAMVFFITNRCEPGGEEGPVLLNIVLEAIWESIVETWESCNYGVRLQGEGTQQALVNHYIRADNVVLLPASANPLKKVVGMLTVALRRA
eukprot:4786103-Pyramimonas_sp.AAC.1